MNFAQDFRFCILLLDSLYVQISPLTPHTSLLESFSVELSLSLIQISQVLLLVLLTGMLYVKQYLNVQIDLSYRKL